MRTVTIAVAWRLSQSLADLVRKQMPQITVRDVTAPFRAVVELERQPGKEQELEEAKRRLKAALDGAEVIVTHPEMPRSLPELAPTVRWVQSSGAGVDRILRKGLLNSHLTFTDTAGLGATTIAEWCVCVMLMFAHKTPRWYEDRKGRLFDRAAITMERVEGRTAGILGAGAIGMETARLSKALGMRTIGLRRSAKERQRNVGSLDELVPPSDLPYLLRESDYVVMALPLTPETTKYIGERELKMMKPTAYILNVGRGPSIDEQALIKALKSGVIAGAGLDVFEVEPLPKDSPLWDMPNVIMSPHTAGIAFDYDQKLSNLVCENLQRYVRGEPLLNVVDKKLGY